MKATCPFCGEVYDVEEDFRGKQVVCAVCEKTFRVPGGNRPVRSKPAKVLPENRFYAWLLKHKKLLCWSVAGLLVLLTGLSICYYHFLPNKWRAINTRAEILYTMLQIDYKIVDEDDVRDLCKQRATLEYLEAEKEKIEEAYIAFWCDPVITDFALDLLKCKVDAASKQDGSQPDYPPEFVEREKEYNKCREMKHPKERELRKIAVKVKKESSPITEVLLRYRDIRLHLLAKLDEQYKKVPDDQLAAIARQKMERLLYNCFLTNDKIHRPEQLKKLCEAQALELVQITDGNPDDRDFALLILSDHFDRKNSNETTRTAFYWLQYKAEEAIANSGYQWRIEHLLEPDSQFRKEYYKISGSSQSDMLDTSFIVP